MPFGTIPLSLCLSTLLLLLAPVANASDNPPVKEDWSTISLPKSLPASEPVIGETDDCSTFTRQLIRVQWRAADPVYLYVMLPKGVRNPPLVLYLYTLGTDTDRFLNEKFGEQLTAGGFAAIGFTSALTGQRYHDRPMKQWFVSELQESLGSSTHDVQMILNYLTARGDVDMTRVGMFGEGSGASIAILAAAADARIKALDLLNPWGDWPVWLAHSSVVPDDERAKYLTPQFLKTVAALDPIKWLPRLSVPVRLQYMNEESLIPAAAKMQIKAAAPSQAQIIPSEEALAKYRLTSGSTFLDWIKVQLRKTPRWP